MGDYRTTMGESKPLPSRTRRRRRWLIAIAVLTVSTGALLAGLLVKVERYVLASGYVTTEHYAEVRPPSVGTVSKILVHTGEVVAEGDLLVQLDATEEAAALEEARRRVSMMEAEEEKRRAEIQERKREQDDAIKIAKLQLENAAVKRQRTEELVERGLKAGSALEDDRLREELVRANLTSLLARDQSIFDKELAVLRQELEARRDAVARAAAKVRAREVRAPISGQVMRYEFVIGELVRPETVLYEIFGGENQVLKLRVAERDAGKVVPGQRYSAQLTSFRGFQQQYFEGTVQHLRNVIQTEGRTTYRVAYCDFNPNGCDVPPGTTSEARIYYGESCFWLYLFNIDL